MVYNVRALVQLNMYEVSYARKATKKLYNVTVRCLLIITSHTNKGKKPCTLGEGWGNTFLTSLKT